MDEKNAITAAEPRLSHLDSKGQARMVDVGHKAASARAASAGCRVRLGPVAWALLDAQANSKGEVLAVARVAGIMAAKRCAELIPLCHSLPLSFVGIDFSLDASDYSVAVTSLCKTSHQTGVEMEALLACNVAALTIYDMCKAADKGIVIEDTRLLSKSGGKSGSWQCPKKQ